MGIAFCVVVSCEIPTPVRNVSCKCHFKATKGECDDLIFISHYWSSDEKGMALYSDNTFLWSVISENCFNEYYEASFEFSASDDSRKLVAMRKCGVQLVYGEETSVSSLLDAADNNFCVISSDSGESIMREDTSTVIKRGSSKISGLEEVEPKHKRIKKCSA
ncbi:hypothetical protein JCGZ_14830 [Jatropha curcas]|uniref:Uncharacterized protein n=2 Tax=Jatropha curcas TaxID=180498 RepID=A0A067KH67_JATCU|nr:hypothetical protein JCGZ_14830 [Jatropha curcas]